MVAKAFSSKKPNPTAGRVTAPIAAIVSNFLPFCVRVGGPGTSAGVDNEVVEFENHDCLAFALDMFAVLRTQGHERWKNSERKCNLPISGGFTRDSILNEATAGLADEAERKKRSWVAENGGGGRESGESACERKSRGGVGCARSRRCVARSQRVARVV